MPTEDDDDYWDDHVDDEYDDPPLYAPGRIAAMTDAELTAEANRQCLIHDMAVDRCEEINSPTIETAAGRLDICSAECKRRGIEWLVVEDDAESEGS
jgi:hypothetical protein